MKQPKSKNTPLKMGTKAPNFRLKVTPDQTVSLSDLLGKPVVISFYPADFSPVCVSQITLYNKMLPKFKKYNAQFLGISVDNVWTHLAFAKDENLHFPLLSDFNPKGEVSRLYNSYNEKEGVSERAIYVVDKDGKIAWGYISPIGINPGADGVLEALEKLQSAR
ncbi:MAG: thioredoxin peroxidase [Candidatus Levybacteria bacterium RBG_16_35_11]|nr:MAG: thioredoxin peroxidase [Candidatus Levybacteria bacterium RBG_16_35_11]